MANEIHEYFKRKSTEWNITDFLDECGEEDFQKMIDQYLRSLDIIANLEQGKRKTKAEFLLTRYRKPNPNSKDNPPDFKKAREWKSRSHRFHIYQPEISGNTINNGTINDGTFYNGLPRETVSKRSNQKKACPCIFDNEKSDEIDNFFRGTSGKNSTNLIEKRQKPNEYNETDIEESETAYDTPDHEEAVDNQDQEEVKDVTSGEEAKEVAKVANINKVRLSKKNREEIDTAFKSMDEQYMWKLSTGRFVEKELYRLGQELEFEHAIHSFIIDIDDELISSHFNDTELEEIDCSAGPHVPDLPAQIAEFLYEFVGKTSLNEIREIIKSKMFGNNYDHEKHHDKDYIIYALYSLVREVQGGSMNGTKLEAWFNCHIWSVIFDQAFGDINVISVVRGESTSLATASRKNMKRKSEERRRMGRRGDWIVRSVTNGDKHEFGAGEAGNVWTDDRGTKFLKEAGLKLPKVLKDMLVKLMKKVDWNRERCAKMQTVGIIHAGLMIMTIHLDNPQGYICRIQRGEVMEVPDNPEKFPSVLNILASVLNLKTVIKETLKVVQASEQTIESFKTAGRRKRPRDINRCQLSDCMSTPKKVKKAKNGNACAEVNDERPYPATPCPGSPSSESLI